MYRPMSCLYIVVCIICFNLEGFKSKVELHTSLFYMLVSNTLNYNIFVTLHKFLRPQNDLKTYRTQSTCLLFYKVNVRITFDIWIIFSYMIIQTNSRVSNMIIRLLRKVYLFISQSSFYCITLCFKTTELEAFKYYLTKSYY